jgi:glycosyltransferase involved in cell wall biosynthesis
MSERPELSVFIQTYQHAAYIRDAVEGVLRQQTPFDFEIVIADDGSTDGTREILCEYRDRHPGRIRLLLPEHNLGPSEIFRYGVAELRGRHVAWLDGDDYWSDERKLVRQLQLLEEHPEWTACFHDAIVVEGGGNPQRPYVSGFGGASLTLADLLRSNCVPSLSVMARGDLVRDLPDWVWSGLWSDWLALVWFAQHGDLGYLPEPLGVYRVHAAGISAGLSRAEQLAEDVRFFESLRGVVAAEHLPLVERSLRERHCQLVVEEAGLPFSGGVAVLGPQHESPTYLNGRNVWRLDGAERLAELDRRDRDGSLAAQLERLRAHAQECEPGVAHFSGGGTSPQPPAQPALHLLAVGPMASWLDRYSRLGRQLRGCSEVVWSDDICALIEVHSAAGPPGPMGALVEIAEVSHLPEPQGLFRAHLDAPAAGGLADAHAVEIAGWAIGGDRAVVAIELAGGGGFARRVPIGVARPDLEQAFPDRPGAGLAGFRATVSLVGTAAETEVEVRAVLADQRRVPFASFAARRRWQADSDGVAPLVSVVVPCYGQARYLEQSIESVLAQTYANLELVVVDDGSPDNARRVVERYPGARLVGQENRGLAAARNAGIRESEGELVVFLDADDRLLPRALELGVEELSRHPEAAFTFGRYRGIGVDGEEAPGEDQPRPADPPYALFLRYNFAGVPATGMFRRAALEQVGNFDEAVPGAEDYDLGLRISRQFPVRPHGEYVVEYRVHGAGMSRQSAKMLAVTLAVLRRQRPYVRRDPQLREAYREGRRFWRSYYGGPLVDQVRANFANREWRAAAAGVASLLRHHPGGLAGLLRRPRAGGAG